MRSASTTLATAAALLARDEAALAARDAAIQAAATGNVAEGIRIQGLVEDVHALEAQLDPSPS